MRLKKGITMSHFAVLVIGENPEEQLKPFNENIEMPRYIEYTKEQLIAKERKSIDDYKNGLYAKFLVDPTKYEAECKNEKHLEYVKNEFPLKLNWTDEQVYADAIKYYDESDLTPEGGVYSTYNPKSKWDWYQLGGRYTGRLLLKPNASGELGDISINAGRKQA